MQETLITTACMGEKYVRSVQEGGKLLLWLSCYVQRNGICLKTNIKSENAWNNGLKYPKSWQARTLFADIRFRNFVKGWAAVLVAGGCTGTGDPAPQVIFSEVIQDHKANRGLAPHRHLVKILTSYKQAVQCSAVLLWCIIAFSATISTGSQGSLGRG